MRLSCRLAICSGLEWRLAVPAIIRILPRMKTATASDGARKFAGFLALVERGQSVRFQKRGRTVARLVPDRDFMPASAALKLFNQWRPTKQDRAAADAIQAQVDALKKEEVRELADRL